jgi:transcriptional regulator with XRE-family HTH domain
MSLLRRKRGPRDLRVLSDVGTRLRDLREECDLSVHDVAQHTGLSTTAIYDWENARKSLDFLVMLRLCRLYQASPEFVLTGHEPRSDRDNPWLYAGPAWGEEIWPDEPTRQEEMRQAPTAIRRWHAS